MVEQSCREFSRSPKLQLLRGTALCKMKHMKKTRGYPRREELEALRQASARSGRSVAELTRDAIRTTVLKPQKTGQLAIWDAEPKRVSVEHDCVHDEGEIKCD